MFELVEDPNEQCGLCGSFLTVLGVLGNMFHQRCRGCGMDWSRELRPEEMEVTA